MKNKILACTGYGEWRVNVSLVNGRIIVSHQNTVTGKVTRTILPLSVRP